jgi:spore germination cell wall hydrolase CwlJ-like protein
VVSTGADNNEAGIETTQEPNEEESQWAGKLLANVGEDSYLNIREEASVDSKVVGKLYPGAGAEIEEKGEEWTKIVSGDVEGYVKNEYCVFEEEAGALAEEICDVVATATGEGIRVRSESNTDSSILTLLGEGDTLKVDKDAEEVDGWVPVEYKGRSAFVSADYVSVEVSVAEAISIQEEQAQKAKAAQTATATTQSASVSASADEQTMLAAIIQCEAGGEPYEGQLAVGAVVMNRVRSGSFPGSISAVIYQSGQFSPVASGKFARVLSSGSISSSCYQAAAQALSGADNTGGALYFHAGTSGSGTVIGNQIFY